MPNMVNTVFQAGTEPSFFESIVVRSCGTLLVTRQDVGELWEIDPIANTGNCIVSLQDVDSLTGLCEISPDIYAVGGGTYRLANHEGTVPGSYGVWVIDLSHTDPKVRLAGKTPAIGQLNGIATWDHKTILAADSYNGKIYRVSVVDGSYSICLDNETMNDPPNSPVTMGVNGLKVREIAGTKYIYYTNTTRMLYCRIPVDGKITATGPAEILSTGFIPQIVATGTPFEAITSATIPAGIANPRSLPSPSKGFMPDDFCFAEDGTTFVTTHPTNMVMRIPPNGGEAIIIAGDFASWEVASATSCAFGRSATDQCVLYVTTAGANVMPINGQTEPAKIVAIKVEV